MALFYTILTLMAGSAVTLLVVYFDEIAYWITYSLDELEMRSGLGKQRY